MTDKQSESLRTNGSAFAPSSIDIRGTTSPKRFPLKTTISAVHRDELAGFLSRVGILALVKAGKVTCTRCGATITLESFGAIARNKNELLAAGLL